MKKYSRIGIKICCFYFILLTILPGPGFSQDSSETFHLGKIPPDGVLLDRGWKFHGGDNPEWADPGFDDKEWQSIDPTQEIQDIKQLQQAGFGWFRLNLVIDDSNILKRQPVLLINQAGASEIYLNGELINRFGDFSTDPKKVRAFDPLGHPFSFPLGKNAKQVLAVRYAIQPNLLYNRQLTRKNPGLSILVNNLEPSVDNYQIDTIRLTGSSMFRVGAFLILAILHFAFFLFYPVQKANLYFCLFALFVLISEFTSLNIIHEVRYIFYSNNLILDAIAISTFFILTAIYYLFGEKRAFIYWTLLVLVMVGIFLNIFSSNVGPLIISNFINFEILRVSIKAVKNKKRGAWIILAGAICFLVFWGFFVTIVFSGILMRHISLSYTIGDLIYNLAFLSIPIATSIYLGLDFAFTNRSLTQKLTEVESLSVKTIAQEKEKQEILSSQKVNLEKQVQQRTAALNQSLENLKSAQEQLIQSEKMASLGELTAGIAHEIQNPLNFVNNFSEVNSELTVELLEEIDRGNFQQAKSIARDIKENEGKIGHHGRRADAIVKNMLQHSRAGTGQNEHTDLNKLADESLQMCYNSFRAKNNSLKVSLQTDLDETIGSVNLNPLDIGRMIWNLYNNAFYAVSEKSKQIGESYEPVVLITTKKMKGEVEIRVKDNGTGIPKQVVDKIFQPFFTTKPTGMGIGLGLSLGYDIIKAHGGEIKVETREGENTEFIVRLPVKN